MSLAQRRSSILYVVDGRHFGGGERVFLQLARGLSSHYRVYAAAVPGGVFEQQIRRTHAEFLGVDLTSRYALRPVVRLRHLIRKYRIDILHSQGARADFYCRLAGRIAGIRHVVCTVAMPVEGFDVSRFKKKIYRWADRWTEKYVHRFIVVSEALRRMLIDERGLPARRVVRIYNGIELARYKPAVVRPDLPQMLPFAFDPLLVGCFGRLVWQKGFPDLIRAMAQVVSTVDGVGLVIVGEGPDRARLEKLVGEVNLSDRVFFAGFAEDVLPWLSTVDIVAIPSLQEGFPMITLEAMAMAKPIVASQIAGIDEQLVHGRSALLVPPRSPSALADAIVSLLRDRQLAATLGSEARLSVETKFSLEKMINATKQLYDALPPAVDPKPAV